MRTRVLVIDTHPVQYRSPIYAEVAKSDQVDLSVVYYNDASARGYHDVEFGKVVKWDTPLLEGHDYEILIPGAVSTRAGFFGFSEINASEVLDRYKPDLVIIHSLNNLIGFKFAFLAKLKRIPCWLRVETQDEAFVRKSHLKSFARKFIYKSAYKLFDGAFCFGELNKNHLVAHGFKERDLVYTRFSTVDRVEAMSGDEKQCRRDNLRASLAVSPDDLVVGFFGKLIPKKDPTTLLEACHAMSRKAGRKIVCLVVGSGELEAELRSRFKGDENISFNFVGFINQNEITNYYLATDILVLPSRREGEVWGLVCNEGLQAGCAIAMSEAVGAAAEFGHLDRCGVFPIGDHAELEKALWRLAQFKRDFEWAASYIANYSTAVSAAAILLVASRYGSVRKS